MLSEDSLFKPCYKCGEEAPYFCRMCKSHMCPSCTCFHLQVAQEAYRYTERTKDVKPNTYIRDVSKDSPEVCVSEAPGELSTEVFCKLEHVASILPNEEELAHYPTTGLEELLQLLNARSRLLRRELDRRFLLVEGRSYYEKPTYFGARGHKEDKAPKRRTPSRKEVGAYELLLDKIQQGSLPLDYLKNLLTKP